MIKHTKPILGTFFVATIVGALSLSASDWPRWLGPAGLNHIEVNNFNPKIENYSTMWKAQIGKGFSSVSVSGNRAVVLGHNDGSDETVYCFDAATGKEIWKFTYPAELLPRMHAGGPNASASIVGDRVVTLSKDGQLFCLSMDDGKEIWKLNLTDSMGIKVPQWGFGSSPVVEGNRIYVSAGRLIAVDLDSGRKIWLSNVDRPAAYATPVPFETNGKSYVVALNGNGVSVHSSTDGAEVAHREVKAQFDLLAPTPYVLGSGSRIFVSANSTSEYLAFDGESLNPVWTTTELKNALNNSVIHDGVIYGIDGRQGTPTCRLVALNQSDGGLLWTKDNFGYGTTIGIGSHLLALTENGELVSTKLAKDSYAEESRLQILGKTCWTTPTFAGGRIYARNDQGALVCLALP